MARAQAGRHCGPTDASIRPAMTPPPRQRPQRNPQFSTASRLIVLREPSARPAPVHKDESLGLSSSQTDETLEWGTHAVTPNDLLPTSTAETSAFHARSHALHASLQGEYEQRSHWHRSRQQTNSRTALLPLPTPPSSPPISIRPPAFFQACFATPPKHNDTTHEDAPEAIAHASSTPAHETTVSVFPVASAVPPPPSPTSSLRSLSPESELAALPARPPAPPSTFASSVRIHGWHRVGSLARGWIVYDLQVTTSSVRFV